MTTYELNLVQRQYPVNLGLGSDGIVIAGGGACMSCNTQKSPQHLKISQIVTVNHVNLGYQRKRSS